MTPYMALLIAGIIHTDEVFAWLVAILLCSSVGGGIAGTWLRTNRRHSIIHNMIYMAIPTCVSLLFVSSLTIPFSYYADEWELQVRFGTAVIAAIGVPWIVSHILITLVSKRLKQVNKDRSEDCQSANEEYVHNVLIPNIKKVVEKAANDTNARIDNRANEVKVLVTNKSNQSDTNSAARNKHVDSDIKWMKEWISYTGGVVKKMDEGQSNAIQGISNIIEIMKSRDIRYKTMLEILEEIRALMQDARYKSDSEVDVVNQAEESKQATSPSVREEADNTDTEPEKKSESPGLTSVCRDMLEMISDGIHRERDYDEIRKITNEKYTDYMISRALQELEGLGLVKIEYVNNPKASRSTGKKNASRVAYIVPDKDRVKQFNDN